MWQPQNQQKTTQIKVAKMKRVEVIDEIHWTESIIKTKI